MFYPDDYCSVEIRSKLVIFQKGETMDLYEMNAPDVSYSALLFARRGMDG